MAKQALLWTALPNGYSKDHRDLRVSLLLSPRLDAEGDTQLLSTFPDFIDWPATLAESRFDIRYGAQTVSFIGLETEADTRIDDSLGLPDSGIWKALFPDPEKVFVEGYKFRDLSTNQVLSFPAATIDDLVRNLYTRLASSADGNLPTATKILSDPLWNDLVSAIDRNDNDDRWIDFRNGVREPKGQFQQFEQGEFRKGDLASNLALFQLFHTPPSKPKIDKYDVPADDPRAGARWLGYEQTELPKAADFQTQIDFHRIIAAMNQYPTLLRLLGLVIDVFVRRDLFNPSSNSLLYAAVNLPQGAPGVTRAPDVSPRTRTMLDSERFQPLTRPSSGTADYQTVDGLLKMDPNVFGIVQADVDGGGLKVSNFARTLVRLKNKPIERIDPTSRTEREIGAPALRNAGFMLVHKNRGAMLKNSFDRQKKYNETAEKIQKGLSQVAPRLYAEDLARGWRIDIWDDKTEGWHSLCRRTADYILNDGEFEINVPEEEGSVRLAATKAPDPAVYPNLIWLHEALISWTGWSLCAPSPGKTIHHNAEDHTDPVGEPEAEVPPGLKLRSAFKAVPGSLPRLRYGRKYWLRARVVDLAGNSLEFSAKDLGAEKPRANAKPYLRYEPISAPALALFKSDEDTTDLPEEGESMDRIAIRTFNDSPADNVIPTTDVALRFAVPTRTTHREAEHHGMIDSNGIVDPSLFAMLAAKDNSLVEEKVVSAGPLVESDDVETGYAVMVDGDALPYLPEPLAVTLAARIFDHPTFTSDKIIRIPVYKAGDNWPDASAFRIEVFEDPGAKPHFDSPSRTLLIPLPKAGRATLRLSVMPTMEALEILGVWNWLTPAMRQKLLEMALNGQHWMLTPWRNIKLVHAVQKPLITPEIVKPDINRFNGSTFAFPQFLATCSIKSTDHLDVLAKWNEPVEDVSRPTGDNRERNDNAYTIKITEPKNYSGTPDYKLESNDRVRFGGFHQEDITPKIHEFHDTRYRRIEYSLSATTSFREYMPPSILTVPLGDTAVETDEHIKVTGKKLVQWIPSSSPPPAPEVLYVVPTFGWVRTETDDRKSSWRRGGGLRVYLNRPWNETGYGEMLAVVLPSPKFTDDPMTAPAVQPLKNFITQWGNDPIWLSSFVSGVSPKRSNFPLARFEGDPTGNWLPFYAPAEESEQPPGPFRVTGLSHPDLIQGAGENAKVEIAPHDVFYDKERRLWYCDIEVDWGTAYYPFIRLALARYQPVSLEGAHLSNIVLADFMALVPDRWLSVTRTTDVRARRVSVVGSTYTDSSSHTEARDAPAMSLIGADGVPITLEAPNVAKSSVVEVWVERFHSALGEDFGWQRESSVSVQRDTGLLKSGPAVKSKVRISKLRDRAKKLLRDREFEVLIDENLISTLFARPTLWEGTVTMPQVPIPSARYRIAVAEYEEYLIDDSRPYDKIPTLKDRRLVYIEYVELD